MKTLILLVGLTTVLTACGSSDSSTSENNLTANQGGSANTDTPNNPGTVNTEGNIPNSNAKIQIVYPPNHSRFFNEAPVKIKGRVGYSNGITANKALLRVTVNDELATINTPEIGLWSAEVTPQLGVNHYDIEATFVDGTIQQLSHQFSNLPKIKDNASIFKITEDKWLVVNNEQILQYNPENGVYSELISDLRDITGLIDHARVMSRDNKSLFLLNRDVTLYTPEDTVFLAELDLETLTLKATYAQGDFTGTFIDTPTAIKLFCDSSEENSFLVYNSSTRQVLKTDLNAMTNTTANDITRYKDLVCVDENTYYFSSYSTDSQSPIAYSFDRTNRVITPIISDFDDDIYNMWAGIGFNDDLTAIYFLARRTDGSKEIIKYNIASGEHAVLSNFKTDIPSVNSFIDENEKTMLYSFENSIIKFHYDTLEKEYLITETTGSGFAFDNSRYFFYDANAHELSIIGWQPDYIARVKLDDLSRSLLTSDAWQYSFGSGLSLDKPAKAFYNPAINAYILGDYASGVLTQIDPNTGERTLFSGALSTSKTRGTGGCTPLGDEVLFDPVQGYIYAAGDSQATDTYLCEIDPVTGDRQVVSSKNIGTGPHIAHRKYLSWDGINKRALVYDNETNSIYWIDRKTGNRKLAYEVSLPGSITDLKMVAEKSLAYIILFETDISKQTLYRIDLESGATTMLYNTDTYPDMIGTYVNEFDISPLDDVLYVLLQEYDGDDMRQLVAWDLETNQTVQISYTYAD